MKIVVICGQDRAGHQMVHQLAVGAGMSTVDGWKEALRPDGADGLAAARAWVASLAEQPLVGGWLDVQPGLVDTWLAADPRVSVILVYGPIGWCLDDTGGGDVRATEAWIDANTELFKVAVRHPTRTALVSALAAIHSPHALVERLATWLDLPMRLETGMEVVDRAGWPAITSALKVPESESALEAESLLQELDSVATFDHESLGLLELERAAAAAEVVQLRRRSIARERLISEQSRNLEAHALQVAALQAALDARARECEVLGAEAAASRDQVQALGRSASELAEEVAALRDQLTGAQLDLESFRGEAFRLQEQEAVASATPARQEEVDTLLLQLHGTQEELEKVYLEHKAQTAEHQKVLAQMARDRDAYAKLAGDYRSATDRHAKDTQGQKAMLEQQSKRQATLQDELKSARSELERRVLEQQALLARIDALSKEADSVRTELSEENETLLVQLHQVQEELEHYYLSNKRLESSLAGIRHEKGLMHQLWSFNQPPDVVIDLREPMEGSNWHERESDGRWMGPELLSTITFPALRSGTYCIQVDVVDAITPEILSHLELELNGQQVPCDPTAEGLPALALGTVSVAQNDRELWTLGLRGFGGSQPERVRPRR